MSGTSLDARGRLDHPKPKPAGISVANRGTIGDYGNLNPPRTFGIELSTRF